MPEAEDVITDAAMHATAALQRWRAKRRGPDDTLTLDDMAGRLAILVQAAFGLAARFRPAQAPLPRTMLDRLWGRTRPAAPLPLPATDGHHIWLPPAFPGLAHAQAIERFRLLALLQAARMQRGAARFAATAGDAAAVFLVLEAWAAEASLVRQLPGLRTPLAGLRASVLAQRPPPGTWLDAALARALCGQAPVARLDGADPAAIPPQDLLGLARGMPAAGCVSDLWLGEFKTAQAAATEATAMERGGARPRSARLPRRPEVRAAADGEDEASAPGPFMVQTGEPHEKAEDPFGMQRPTDRDTDTAASDFGDALSELAQARLLRSASRPDEVLLSDDPLECGAPSLAHSGSPGTRRFQYPEWDHHAHGYIVPGSTVHVAAAQEGPRELVERMLAAHAHLLEQVRRRFEMLRAERQRRRRQLDGDEIDIEAWVDAAAAHAAGLQPDPRLYASTIQLRRDMAALLLVDVSGSTDGWLSGQSRVIDVAREAVLLVSHALAAMGEPFSVLAFSGEGAHGVVVREVKTFDESFGMGVKQRIAGLEPEDYTRAGSAIRHASAMLAAQAARHRLLIMLTDGKPNDADRYQGEYGLHDMRQAVAEARQDGIVPFALTIDRQAAHYLPQVFGERHFAILPRTDMLPAVLLAWLRKLVS